ncbi:MAG: TIGR00730 family Rossman fold protein [Actinomycetota bacterium]
MPTEITSLCVYCGSSPGHDPVYVETARALGRHLAERSVRMVYGGGAVGLMGRTADAVMAAGGEVTGIIPVGLFSREIAHQGLTELVEVDTMHTRKREMFDRADAFIALPGGLGTLEELAEILTWSQLGVHNKPVGVLDVDGYWQPFFDLLDRAVAEGFMKEENLALLVRGTDPAELLDALAEHDAPVVDKWLEPDET